MTRIYLDANATYLPFLGLEQEAINLYTGAANASSIHSEGQKARALIEAARENVLDLIGLGGVKDYRLVFTSGATESNNAAIHAACFDRYNRDLEVITSSIEHPSLLEPLRVLETEARLKTRVLAPAAFKDITEVVSDNTAFVSLMWANNEVGCVLPVSDIAKQVKKINSKKQSKRILVHSDAVQALGKLDFSLAGSEIDLLSFSGHKIGAFAGVGALLVKQDLEYRSFLLGGPQEVRFRAGTENLLGIISFGLAARYWKAEGEKIRKNMEENSLFLATFLEEALGERAKIFSLEGFPRLPNTLSVRFPGIRADDLVVALDLAGVAVSTGSACASGKQDPSPVLLALGFSEEKARETIRISLRGFESREEIERVGRVILEVERNFRS